MATLDKLIVRDFRNIAVAELRFSPKVNCIWGNNGEGKTNLIDAIWYLSMTKSAFAVMDRYNFRHGTDSFSLSGDYTMDNGTTARFSMEVGQDGKKLRRDDEPLRRISEHIGDLPIVMVSPQDGSMVSESGEERRRFLNAVLSQMDRSYLEAMQQYNRVLSQRNRLLKEERVDGCLLDVFDSRLDALSGDIYEKRKEFTAQLDPVVEKYYGMISGGHEEVSVEYSSDLSKGSMGELLAASRDKDAALGYTSVGLQRDDLSFLLGGHSMRRCGSQGQQKSFLVALKFAQYDLMREQVGRSPMLLLDDVFDKLDYSRISNLLAMVSGADFGQIFITDSNKVRISGLLDRMTTDSAYYETEAGSFTRTEADMNE